MALRAPALLLFALCPALHAAGLAELMDPESAKLAQKVAGSYRGAASSTRTLAVQLDLSALPQDWMPLGLILTDQLTRHLSREGRFQLLETASLESVLAPQDRTPKSSPDLVLAGRAVTIGESLTVSVRLVETRSRKVLLVEEHSFELPPSAAPASGAEAAVPAAPGAAAPSKRKKSVWASAAALSRGGGVWGPHGGIAIRESSGRWELGFDVGSFGREKIFDITDAAGRPPRGQVQRLDVTYYRFKLSYLHPLRHLGVPGFLTLPFNGHVRLGAGVSITDLRGHFFREGSGMFGNIPTLEADDHATRTEPLFEFGLARSWAERWEAHLTGELVPQRRTVSVAELPYGGFAIRLGLAYRLL